VWGVAHTCITADVYYGDNPNFLMGGRSRDHSAAHSARYALFTVGEAIVSSEPGYVVLYSF